MRSDSGQSLEGGVRALGSEPGEGAGHCDAGSGLVCQDHQAGYRTKYREHGLCRIGASGEWREQSRKRIGDRWLIWRAFAMMRDALERANPRRQRQREHRPGLSALLEGEHGWQPAKRNFL